jgi:hypothetical protein
MFVDGGEEAIDFVTISLPLTGAEGIDHLYYLPLRLASRV